jgi:hypothetical protein
MSWGKPLANQSCQGPLRVVALSAYFRTLLSLPTGQ